MKTDGTSTDKQSSQWNQGTESKEQGLHKCLYVGGASCIGQCGPIGSCLSPAWQSELVVAQTKKNNHNKHV